MLMLLMTLLSIFRKDSRFNRSRVAYQYPLVLSIEVLIGLFFTHFGEQTFIFALFG